MTRPSVAPAAARASCAEACARLRRAGTRVPFILLSPAALAGLHDVAVMAGAALVVDKPFDLSALAEAVASAARH